MRFSALGKFIVKVLLLLPVCYWAWYNAAGFICWIAANLTEQLLVHRFTHLIAGIEPQGKLLDVVTQLTPPQYQHRGNTGGIVFSVNPLNFNFGLPLCLALVIASPGSLLTLIRNILISTVILQVVQIWGIYFEILKTVFFDLSAYLEDKATPTKFHRDVIATGYQLGTLILPSATPLIIWLAFYRKFVISIAPALNKIDT